MVSDLKKKSHNNDKREFSSKQFLIGSKKKKKTCHVQSCFHADGGSTSERKNRKENGKWRTEEGDSNTKLLPSPPLC